ncbi:MAG: radical SAM protein, partial [Dehalococcoidales bacterium]
MTPIKNKDAGRQLSRETGTVIKDWGGRLPIALVYPNSYYLGMSNLGIHTIYSLLNNYKDVVCERVFKENQAGTPEGLPLSLESKRPLADFSLIAFSVSYELDYFNIVSILKASGIPLYAADRDERHPLVIAGGPCVTANPAPLAPFFDCLCIGDAEPILPRMLPLLREGLNGRRDDLMKEMAKLDGVYAPRYYNGIPVKRQWAQNLDEFPTHTAILTPDTELGNLYLIEVERGCNWGCRFCMVGTVFSPMRFRSVDNIIEQAEQGLKHRKRLGLVGPAVCDHPRFEELVAGLLGLGAELSVSSLRIKPFPEAALREMMRSGARTIALAPEAGSQRLRDVIRKNISESDILEAVDTVAGEDIKQIKLYYMIGLPTETDDDIEQMIKLTLDCKAILDKRKPGRRIALSVATFVPKAGTPFQWLPMEQVSVLNKRLSLLRNRLAPSG